MNRMLQALMAALVLGAMTAPPAQAVLKMIEESVEAVSLEVRVDRSLNGYVVGAQCQGCKSYRFKVTPETRYLRNHQKVDPAQAASFSGKPGTIVFDIKTRKATKIVTLE